MTTDYLRIEPWLQDALPARALQAAFESGVIDVLESQASVTEPQLRRVAQCDEAGLRCLLQVLVQSGVIETFASPYQLTQAFRAVLPYRDLIVTKLQFAELVAPDFFARFPLWMRSADEFMATSRLFELFDYGRCRDVTPQNCLQAARWMKLTTMLTRYEAPVCCQHFSFAPHRRMLDLGGNSGEFALQVCRQAPELQATVADLPVVCHVGERHVAGAVEASRIQFRPFDFQQQALPAEYDLITCKSVLHDWPDDAADMLVRKAFAALPRGGVLLIFERCRWDFMRNPLSWGQLPVLLFFRSYREPGFYVDRLRNAGFADIQSTSIPLEVPFLLVTGRKP